MRKLALTVTAGCLLALALLALPAPVHAQLPSSPRRFVDFLDTRCYQITNQPPLNVPLRLDHLNPVLTGMHLPFENVVLGSPQQLCVPVAKNQQFPPPTPCHSPSTWTGSATASADRP